MTRVHRLLPLRGCVDAPAVGLPASAPWLPPAWACFMAERSFPPCRELGTGAGGADGAAGGPAGGGGLFFPPSPFPSSSPSSSPSTRWLTKTLACVLR